jgi:hypothetical protein
MMPNDNPTKPEGHATLIVTLAMSSTISTLLRNARTTARRMPLS